MNKPKPEAKTIGEHIKDLHWFVVIVLLLVITVQGYAAIKQLSLTYDEPDYLTTGYAILKTGDMQFGVGNPPLIKYIISIPLFIRGISIPVNTPEFNAGSEFSFSLKTLYGLYGQFESIVIYGRLMTLLLSIILGFFVYLWASKLFGKPAGIFALFLYTFEPNIIAGSTLATIDLGVTAFIFISMYFAQRFFVDRSIISAALSGVFLAFSLASKGTAIILIPAIILISFLYKFPEASEIRTGKTLNRWQGLAVILFSSFMILWAIYGFQFEPLQIPRDIQNGSGEYELLGRTMMSKYFAYFHGFPLPASSWITGMFLQLVHAKAGHSAYLAGRYSDHGWALYYPLAFLIKTPLPVLIMLMIGLFLMFRELAYRRDRLAVLMIPIIMTLWSLTNNIDIGLRNLLPIYPFILVFISQIAKYKFLLQQRQKIIIPIACAWMLITSLNVFPEYLAYFNELVGGPKNGYKYLLDSNYDWGQGLIQARQYMDENDIGAVKFAYFGSVNPGLYGVLPKPMSQQETLQPEKDIYFISATALYDVYSKDHQAWLWAREREPTDRIGYSIFVYDMR